MRWSWKLARVSGIDIRMHWTFLLILLWISVSQLAAGHGAAGAAYMVALVLSVFFCVVLHELGHALAARRYGIGTRDITLLPIGGVARLERMPSDPKQELVVALAGPLVNVVIAGVLFVGLLVGQGLNQVTAVPQAANSLAEFGANLLWINVALVVFNLLPAFPMDGGRVLRALLAMRMDYIRATEIAATTGQLMAIVFGSIGLFTNPFLVFIAIFVYLGAEAEAQQVRVRDMLEGVTVERAMVTRFRTLAPEDTLETAADALLAGDQTDFPIVDSGGLRGVLQRNDLIQGLRSLGPKNRVFDAMSPIIDHALEQDSLEETIQRMKEQHRSAIPVLRNDQVVGILSMDNIGELVMLRSAINGFSALQTPEVRQAV